MEKIKSFIQKPIAIGVAGLLVGLIIGLVVLGWGMWPLQWVDASPSDLQMDYQRDYLCMVIDSYIRNQDDKLVQLRWQGLGDKSTDLLTTLTPAVCRFSSNKEINAFGKMVNAAPKAEVKEDAVSDSVNPLEPAPEENGKISLMPLAILMLLTLVVGAIFVFLLIEEAERLEMVSPKSKKKKVQYNLICRWVKGMLKNLP